MNATSHKERCYPEATVAGFTNVDGTIAFYLRIQEVVESSSVVLDIGCGRGRHQDDPVSLRRQLRTFQGKAKKVIGIDVDQAASGNPFIDDFHLINGSRWPLDSDTIDIAVADYVLEHIPYPLDFFKEASRVIRPGGMLCLRTTNALGYVALAARLIPNRLHAKILKKVQEDRQEADVFPTVFKCNTVGKIQRQLHQQGFQGVVYGHEAEPGYLEFSSICYRLGTVIHKLTPRCLSSSIHAFATLNGKV